MKLLGDVFAAMLLVVLWLCASSMAVIISVTLVFYTMQSLAWALTALSAALQ